MHGEDSEDKVNFSCFAVKASITSLNRQYDIFVVQVIISGFAGDPIIPGDTDPYRVCVDSLCRTPAPLRLFLFAASNSIISSTGDAFFRADAMVPGLHAADLEPLASGELREDDDGFAGEPNRELHLYSSLPKHSTRQRQQSSNSLCSTVDKRAISGLVGTAPGDSGDWVSLIRPLGGVLVLVLFAATEICASRNICTT